MCFKLFFLFPYLLQSDVAYKRQMWQNYSLISKDEGWHFSKTDFIVGVILPYFTLLGIKQMVYKNPKYFQINLLFVFWKWIASRFLSWTLRKVLLKLRHWAAVAISILTLSWSFLDIYVFPKELVSPALIRRLLLSIFVNHKTKPLDKNSLLSYKEQLFLLTSLKGTRGAWAQNEILQQCLLKVFKWLF